MASNPLTEGGWIRRFRESSFPSFRTRASCQRSKQGVDRKVVRQHGFTLIELMIVIAIIGIAAALAYPSYIEQVRKTRRSDGKAALLEAAQVLERCYTEFNRYNAPAAAPGCPAVNGAGNGLAGAYTTSKEGYYTIAAGSLTATAFTLQATPAAGHSDDNDATKSNRCGVLTYSNTGLKGVVPATGTLSAAVCW